MSSASKRIRFGVAVSIVVSEAENARITFRFGRRGQPLHMISSAANFLLLVSFAGILCFSSALTIHAQATPAPQYKSQEFSEKDGIPVLMEHLPESERVRPQTTFAHSIPELKAALGERPILDLIDFSAGTEAVTAPYDAGKLLIVEFTSPQGSVDADNKINSYLAGSDDGTTVYRRIGNYNALVFDASDKSAANALLDEVKYEKQIQWLGDNPFRITAERAFVITTSDIFLSTVIVIVLGIVFSIVFGLVAGFIYFQLREKRRAAMSAYTDAGGMTRLNLDGFTPEIVPERLLGKR